MAEPLLKLLFNRSNNGEIFIWSVRVEIAFVLLKLIGKLE